MERSIPKILAINPGTRYFGIAIFHDLELREWAVKVIREGSTKERSRKMENVINELIERYSVNTLAVKALHPARSSPKLNSVVSQIKKIACERNLALRQLSINEVKTILSPHTKLNKKKLMEEMATRYPDLYPELERESKSRNPYLVRMFEAVALGTAYLNDTELKSGKVEKIEEA